jgi:hypothetical protein
VSESAWRYEIVTKHCVGKDKVKNGVLQPFAAVGGILLFPVYRKLAT